MHRIATIYTMLDIDFFGSIQLPPQTIVSA